MAQRIPVIGLMLGDMTGIGPEIGAKLLAAGTLKQAAPHRGGWKYPDEHQMFAALNPHGGESGLFGDEEIRIIKPTVEQVHATGINCSGPVPSDVIFLKALKGEYDGVVMMYHDQGQIATKLLGFNQGVTVTAGLKTVFTTPAHGTAYDIVGQGKAEIGAMEHAYTLAAKLAAG